ncbi:hypothetical protein [Sorangium sp. So ce176]|uniref:hypothetical protein n=1 Tax=Sorangium sp. So ce176 TaxID=3133286 RepID=UPI003F5D58C8
MVQPKGQHPITGASGGGRPPHPATVVQPKGQHPITGASGGGRPPHPATVVQPKGQPGSKRVGSLQRSGGESVSDIRYKFHRNILEMAVESVFPVWKVVISPENYPGYGGGLNGFDITALPKVYNPIIAAGGPKGFELLWGDFIDGEKVKPFQPKSDGYIYREFHTTQQNKIIAFAEIEPGGSPTWNEIKTHWTLGYLGIRKAALEEKSLTSVLVKKYGVPLGYLNPANQKHYALYDFYRHLDVEEQGLSTNLARGSAQFMQGCKMHRLSIASFLKRFPFGTDSELILDWDYGYRKELAPARDPGHVDIKLNPLWLDKEKPWRRHMKTIDGNFYRDRLNAILSANKDLWEPAP